MTTPIVPLTPRRPDVETLLAAARSAALPVSTPKIAAPVPRAPTVTNTSTPALSGSAAKSPASAQPTASPKDVVEVSDAARAQLLRQQGVSIAEIAVQLGLDAATVKGYFPLSE